MLKLMGKKIFIILRSKFFVHLNLWCTQNVYSGLKVIPFVSCSAQMDKKFVLAINFKMPTIVGILKFMT